MSASSYSRKKDSNKYHSERCNSDDSSSSCSDHSSSLPKRKSPRYIRDAVVTVSAEFLLMGSNQDGPLTQLTGDTPLTPGLRADIVLEFNGYFVKEKVSKKKKNLRIVTVSQGILIPPTLLSSLNRYPLVDGTANVIGANGTVKNVLTRASRIFATVYNVNGTDKSYIYETELVGLDGAGDIAVLKICENGSNPWNCSNPKIKKHPYLKWGDSCSSKPGDIIYLIGDFINNNISPSSHNMVGGIVEGVLSDNSYIDYNGWMLQECLVVSSPVYKGNSGLPILNKDYQIIGMQTSNLSGLGSDCLAGSSPGYVAGPSQFFMEKVVKTLIEGMFGENRCHLETINDNIGSYYSYIKSYLGLAYRVFRGIYYDSTRDFTSGLPISDQIKIRLDANGKFLSSPENKKIYGVQVIGLAGLNPNDAPGIVDGTFYVPGGTGTAPLITTPLPISPLTPRIVPGDMIYKFGDGKSCDLGDLTNQVAPSLQLWNKLPGANLYVHYRKGGTALNADDNSLGSNYNDDNCVIVKLEKMPPIMDYPWYAVDIFPRILYSGGSTLYPSFNSPLTQLEYPPYPQLNTADVGKFHPAL